MAKTVIGLFDQFEEARDAIQDLTAQGIPQEDVSLVLKNDSTQYTRDLGVRVERVGDEVVGEGEGEPAAKGAGIGAVLGGAGGLLLGLGALVIPGIGPVLAAGPLVAALGGAGIGAVTGGLIGSLTGAGVPENDAHAYAEGVRKGSVLVVVNAPEAVADRAAEIINQHHAVDIGTRAGEWRNLGWQGFNEDVEPYAFQIGAQGGKQRSPQSAMDFGPGARAYLEGMGIGSYDHRLTEIDQYLGDKPSNWRMYESRFRQDFEDQYAPEGKRWEDYRDAYRFGFDLGQLAPYSNSTWAQVVRYAEQGWNSRMIGKPWVDYRHAVEEGWKAGHTPGSG